MSTNLDFILSVDTTGGRAEMQRFNASLADAGNTAAAMGVKSTKALTAIKDGTDHVKIGLRDGMGELRSFANSLGVTLPYATEKWLAKVQSLQPLMAAAFSTSAILGFGVILADLPKAFDSVASSITGWNEKSKKAYADFLSDNQKAIERVSELKAKLTEVGTISLDPTAGKREALKSQITDAEANAKRLGETLTRLQNQKNQIEQNYLTNSRNMSAALNAPPGSPESRFPGNLPTRIDGKSASDLQVEIDKFDKLSKDASATLITLNDQLKVMGKEAATTATKGVLDLRRSIAADLISPNMPLRGGFPINAPPVPQMEIDPLTGQMSWHAPSLLSGGSVDPYAEAQYQFQRKLDRTVGADLMAHDMPLRGGGFPTRELTVPELVPTADWRKPLWHNQTFLANGQVDLFREEKWDELKKKQTAFTESFREGAGHVWDDFFIKGQNILTSLANLAKGLLNTIGRTLFQDFAAGLVGGRSNSGGLAGGLTSLGGRIGGAISLGAIFGTGSATAAGGGGIGGLLGGGGGGLLAGLIGHGATTQALVSPMGVPYTLTHAAGGLSGALGLGGGAGLLGLGAATIPVLGGIAAGVFGLYKLFHHGQAKVAMTPDPFAAMKDRTLWFNSTFPFENLTSAVADLAGTTRRLSGSIDNLDTKQPGVLMKENVVAIKGDIRQTVADGMEDRSFRKAIATGVLD